MLEGTPFAVVAIRRLKTVLKKCHSFIYIDAPRLCIESLADFAVHLTKFSQEEQARA